jgi:hypothetical protein
MARAAAKRVDPTVYPSEDHLGETEWHRAVCVLLYEVARRWVASQARRAHVGSNQFGYWIQHRPTSNICPDLYLIEGLGVGPPGLDVVKTWEHGVPRLSVAIVSGDWRKDYQLVPRHCEDIGVEELIVFDDEAPRPRTSERVRWQVFRRDPEGRLVCVERTNEDRVHSVVLGAWLREVGKPGDGRVRVATGPHGDTLVPTAAEELERERQSAERERRAREAAEAEVARLRAELAQRSR